VHQSDFFSRAAREGLPTLVRGKGARLIDADGKGYVDAGSGAILTNLGQGNRRVIKAMARQGRRLSFTYVRNSRHLPNEALAHRLAEMNSSGYAAAYLSTTGSDAVEAAIKLARVHAITRGEPERACVLSLRPCYHGGTLATLALSGDEGYRDYAALGGLDCRQVDSPFVAYAAAGGSGSGENWSASLRGVADEARRLGRERLLALVLEPIGGVSTGAYCLPRQFLKGVRALCDDLGMYLIYDEIMAHIRSGWFLTTDRLAPDERAHFVAIGKGLGAGYTPIAATLTTQALMEEIAGGSGFNLSHTYNANPISCATALAVLNEIERQDLLHAAREKGAQLTGALRQLQTDGLGIEDVRGSGLLIGVQLARHLARDGSVSPSELVRVRALKNGLVVYARDMNGGKYGHWIMVAPPLTISSKEIDELVSRLRRTLQEVERRA
jgi:adenosylmethionine-8-amino-7-oxononanoate aminotransferase